MRVTPQRVAILRAVEAAGDHPDAETVYRLVLREYPHISRDTVYRTLAVMEEKGMVRSVATSGRSKRYDPNPDRHHHLVCVRCQKIVDFAAGEFDILPALPAVAKGFKVLRTTVHVEVICKTCLGKG